MTRATCLVRKCNSGSRTHLAPPIPIVPAASFANPTPPLQALYCWQDLAGKVRVSEESHRRPVYGACPADLERGPDPPEAWQGWQGNVLRDPASTGGERLRLEREHRTLCHALTKPFDACIYAHYRSQDAGISLHRGAENEEHGIVERHVHDLLRHSALGTSAGAASAACQSRK